MAIDKSDRTAEVTSTELRGLPPVQAFTKRSIDLVASILGLVVLSPIILWSWLVARRDTGGSGFFRQERIGRYGDPFKVVKLRTMAVGTQGTTVTAVDDDRITKWGSRFRRYKIDEIPQLWNVMLGQMSLVGPRPDVAGFADRLEGDDRAILALRPGITGPATLFWRDEELVLSQVDDPERYNREVIYPDKVARNLEYLRNYSTVLDFRYILATVFSGPAAPRSLPLE